MTNLINGVLDEPEDLRISHPYKNAWVVWVATFRDATLNNPDKLIPSGPVIKPDKGTTRVTLA